MTWQEVLSKAGDGWHAVVVRGRVEAVFDGKDSAEDYANAVRDAIGEPRSVPWLVKVVEVA